MRLMWRDLGWCLILTPLGRRLRSMAELQIFDKIITDRGSKYAVSGCVCTSKAEAQKAVKQLKRTKAFARATHNSWAVHLSAGGPVKNDDGEAGAGMVILRMLERAELRDHLVVVTRWFGGVELGGDRFRRVQDAVRFYLEQDIAR